MAAQEKLSERVNAATRVLDARRGPAADLPDDEDALREAWEAGDVDWRRAVIKAVIDQVVVKPVKKPTSRGDVDRRGRQRTGSQGQNLFEPHKTRVTW